MRSAKMDAGEAAAAALNSRLLERYTEAVGIDLLRDLSEQCTLSSLFVPAVGGSYARSRVRTMIVGRETAGWGPTLRADLANPGRLSSVRAYLDLQMAYHQAKLPEIAARSKFFQFYREAAHKLTGAEDGPVWANLFCFDSSGTRPDRGDAVKGDKIIRLSGALLRIQIEVLQPDLVIFATGSSCDRYIKQMFSGLSESKVHIPKRVWEFALTIPAGACAPKRVRAFRTPHPRHSGSNRARSAILADVRAPGALEVYLASTRDHQGS